MIDPENLTDGDLLSATTKAEAILNSRPIATLAQPEQGDLEPLTSAHVLKTGKIYQDLVRIEPGSKLTTRWHHMQGLLDKFWDRLVEELVPLLQSRQKWHSESYSPKVGDIVIILQTKERGVWPLGRIINATPNSPDGLVRNGDIKVGESVFSRPLNYIVPIGRED